MSILKVLITALVISTLSSVAIADLPPGKYKIDPAHTSVAFLVDHLGYSQLYGRFNDISGDVSVNPEGRSLIKVNIVAASIDTNHKKRDDHLRSPDFFNTKQFPEIKFITPLLSKSDVSKGVLQGEVEMMGIKKPIKLVLEEGKKGKDPWGLYRIGYTANGVIKRSDFGMDFMQGGIGDDINLMIQIEAIKQ